MYLTHPDLSKYWVIDIEADSLTPTVIWCIVCKNVGTKERKVFVNHELGTYSNLLDGFNDWVMDVGDYFVGHNALSFDIPNVNRLLGTSIPADRVVDTLVLSQLYDPNMLGGHSLDAWGERLRLPKGKYSDWSKLTPEMVTYCIQDVDITTEVFLKLTARMHKYNYSELSCDIEHRIREVINEQERNGFGFDITKAEALLRRLRSDQEDLGGFIGVLFPPTLERQDTYTYRTKADGTPYQSYYRHLERYPRVDLRGLEYDTYDWVSFNIGSPQQRVTKLLSLGWKPTQYTPKGNPKVDEDSLVAFANESGVKEVQAIADWIVLQGRASMVEGWIREYNPLTKAIHGKVWSCGAASRRMRHTEPNTANIPSNEAKYGEECRSCWTARKGRVLVGGDAASLEMRMFLDALGGPKDLVALYLEGDPHQRNADALSEALIGFPGLAMGKDMRRRAKSSFYAFLYGAQDPKLGDTVVPGGGRKAGAIARDVLFSTTPGLKELVKEINREYRANDGRIRLIDGGFNRCSSPHAALNFKLQGNGAIVMKVGSIILRRKLIQEKIDAFKVGDIHDEYQFDSHPDCAVLTGESIVTSLEEAGVSLGFCLPITGNYKIGNTWAETH